MGGLNPRTAKDPYRGTPSPVLVPIVGIVLVDIHVIIITIAVHGVTIYMMEPIQFSHSRNRSLLTKIRFHSYLRVKKPECSFGLLIEFKAILMKDHFTVAPVHD